MSAGPSDAAVEAAIAAFCDSPNHGAALVDDMVRAALIAAERAAWQPIANRGWVGETVLVWSLQWESRWGAGVLPGYFHGEWWTDQGRCGDFPPTHWRFLPEPPPPPDRADLPRGDG